MGRGQKSLRGPLMSLPVKRISPSAKTIPLGGKVWLLAAFLFSRLFSLKACLIPPLGNIRKMSFCFGSVCLTPE